MTYVDENHLFTTPRPRSRVIKPHLEDLVFLKIALWCAAICLAIILAWNYAYSQDIKVYERLMGDNVTFAWDHTSANFLCTKDQKTISFPYGTGGTWTCDGKTYQVTWSGNTIKIANWWPDGPVKDYTAAYKYNYVGYKQPVFTGISLPAKGVGSYPFTITTAGKYIAYGYTKVDADSGGMNSYSTAMDGVKLGEGIWDTPIVSDNVGPLGTWVWWRINSRGQDPHDTVYNLSIGQHTLTLTDREPGTGLKGIVIVPEGSPPTTGGETKVFEDSVIPN